MTIKELCEKYGTTQTELSRRFGIPLRTVQGWHNGTRQPPAYVVDMMEELLLRDKRDRAHESQKTK